MICFYEQKQNSKGKSRVLKWKWCPLSITLRLENQLQVYAYDRKATSRANMNKYELNEWMSECVQLK